MFYSGKFIGDERNAQDIKLAALAVVAKIENTVLSQKDMTAIVITHKLAESILKKYDGIIVLHKGRIAEYGTFDELMERKGKFYGLFTLSN